MSDKIPTFISKDQLRRVRHQLFNTGEAITSGEDAVAFAVERWLKSREMSDDICADAVSTPDTTNARLTAIENFAASATENDQARREEIKALAVRDDRIASSVSKLFNCHESTKEDIGKLFRYYDDLRKHCAVEEKEMAAVNDSLGQLSRQYTDEHEFVKGNIETLFANFTELERKLGVTNDALSRHITNPPAAYRIDPSGRLAEPATDDSPGAFVFAGDPNLADSPAAQIKEELVKDGLDPQSSEELITKTGLWRSLTKHAEEIKGLASDSKTHGTFIKDLIAHVANLEERFDQMAQASAAQMEARIVRFARIEEKLEKCATNSFVNSVAKQLEKYATNASINTKFDAVHEKQSDLTIKLNALMSLGIGLGRFKKLEEEVLAISKSLADNKRSGVETDPQQVAAGVRSEDMARAMLGQQQEALRQKLFDTKAMYRATPTQTQEATLRKISSVEGQYEEEDPETEARLKTIEQHVSVLRERMFNLDQMHVEHGSSIRSLQVDSTTLHSRIAGVNTTVTKTQSRLDTLVPRIADLEVSRGCHVQAIKKLEEDVHRHAGLNAAVVSIGKDMDNLRNRVDDQGATMVKLSKKYKEDEAAGKLSDKTYALKAAYTKISRLVSVAAGDIDKLNGDGPCGATAQDALSKFKAFMWAVHGINAEIKDLIL